MFVAFPWALRPGSPWLPSGERSSTAQGSGSGTGIGIGSQAAGGTGTGTGIGWRCPATGIAFSNGGRLDSTMAPEVPLVVVIVGCTVKETVLECPPPAPTRQASRMLPRSLRVTPYRPSDSRGLTPSDVTSVFESCWSASPVLPHCPPECDLGPPECDSSYLI